MSVRIPVKPELIGWALEQARMSPSDFKKQETPVLSWLERESQPTLAQLQKFANKTHVPFGYLMLSEPPELAKPAPDFRRRGSTARQYSQELTETIYEQQRRQDWFRDYALEYGISQIDWVGSASTGQSPAKVAAKLRAHWGFSTLKNSVAYSESRSEVFSFIESIGVLISISGHLGHNTHRPFSVDEFSGFSLADDYAPLIFVNGKESHAAQIFTIFHELGHLVLGESAVSDTSLEDQESHAQNGSSERWCDEFAAAFLMPEFEVKQAFSGDLNEQTLLSVAKKFRVSVLSLLNRLRDLRLISFEQWDSVYPDFKQRAFEVLEETSMSSGGGDFYKKQRYLSGRRFSRALYRDTWSGRTSYAEAMNLLGLPKAETFNKFAQEVSAQ